MRDCPSCPRLTGIDLDEAALAAARHRADQAGIAGRASFRRGSFSDTGLPGGSAQAVMSVDALLFAPGKRAAAAELARILVPGGRLVLTSWDYHRQPAGRPAQVADHRPLLERAGFDVIGYGETEAWRDRHERTGRALLAAAERTGRRIRRAGRTAAGTHYRDERRARLRHPPRSRDRPAAPPAQPWAGQLTRTLAPAQPEDRMADLVPGACSSPNGSQPAGPQRQSAGWTGEAATKPARAAVTSARGRPGDARDHPGRPANVGSPSWETGPIPPQTLLVGYHRGLNFAILEGVIPSRQYEDHREDGRHVGKIWQSTASTLPRLEGSCWVGTQHLSGSSVIVADVRQ